MSGYLLDTMVVSEGQRPTPNERVGRWLSSVDLQDTYLSAFTIGEIRYGIARLSEGAKRTALERWLSDTLIPGYRDRIIPFDARAALAWGNISATAATSGVSIPNVDAQIAAIAQVHSLTLVTRNVRHFAECGIAVIDPWGKFTAGGDAPAARVVRQWP